MCSAFFLKQSDLYLEFLGKAPNNPKLRSIEEQTILMLERVVGKTDQDVTEVAKNWLYTRQQEQQSGRSLSVIEHSALMYLLKIDFFDKATDIPQASTDVQIMLEKSWETLTQKPAPENLLSRLPKKLQRRMNKEEKLFHDAVFEHIIPRHKPSVSRWRLAARFAAVSLIPIALYKLGLEALASVSAGYMISSIAEYIIHKHMGHASPKLKDIASRAGRFGKFILDMTYSHTDIHHNSTYKRRYDEQFVSKEEQRKLDEELHALEALGERVIKDRYGLTISTISYLKGLFVAMPVHMTLIWTLGLSPESTALLLAPSLLYGAASKFVHPVLHESRDTALNSANAFERWMFKTPYIELISRLHFGHHRGGFTGNYNLVFGADWLFGELFMPNMRQVLQMRKLGLIGASWTDQELGR